MERKRIVFFLLKALSDVDRGAFKQKIKHGKTPKNAARHEKLFLHLEKAVKANNIEKINPDKLIKALKLSSVKKLTPLYGELIEDIKSFLIHSSLQKEELLQKLLLQKELCRKEESQYIDLLHQDIIAQISDDDQAVSKPETYLWRSSFYKSFYTHPNTNSQENAGLDYLNLSETNLELFYWITKLRLLIEKANRGVILEYEKYLLTDLPKLPDLNNFILNDSSCLLKIYVSVYQFALTPFQQEDLQEVLALVTKHSQTIPLEDKERLFNFLVGIIGYYKATRQTNLSTYEIYLVYKTSFTNLWLVQDNGLIYFEDVLNMLLLAFSVEDFVLLNAINNNYRQYIAEADYPFVSMLFNSYVFFLQGKWNAVLSTFSNQRLPHKAHRIHFIVHRNIIEIKALFQALIEHKIELRNILNYLEKHQRFIQRKESYPENKKHRVLNFLNFLRYLHSYLIKRANSHSDKKEIQQWLNEVISTHSNTIEQDWLKSIGETLLQEFEVK